MAVKDPLVKMLGTGLHDYRINRSYSMTSSIIVVIADRNHKTFHSNSNSKIL
jgi:hypothetical protein